MNAIHLPSGDHFGSLSLSPAVNIRAPFAAAVAAPSPVGKSQSDVLLSFFSMSKRVTALHASAPSGDSVGVPMRRIAQSDSTSSGGLCFAGRRVAPRSARGIAVSL